jgi:beta-aspartyl-dipeptidase (metallo-type)
MEDYYMIKLIKGAEVYSPDYLGIKDILIVGSKIASIRDNIILPEDTVLDISVIDGSGKIACPGFIDSHVHILGGGGEGGYKTRTPEIQLTDIITGGVTTVVGCLGTDGITRSMESLVAKSKALEEEGITTFIYTGNYRIPVTTVTGDIMKDILMIDKIIGVGEIALSDHRSSQPSLEEFKRVAADARVGGILSGKAGIVNVHMGSGDSRLNYIFEIVEKSEIPITQFLPTHITRSQQLFKEGIRYAKAGGYIDFTTSSNSCSDTERKDSPGQMLKVCLDKGVSIDKISFSSDGQGSLPKFNEKKEFAGLEVGKVTSLFNQVRDAVFIDGIPFEIAIKVITSNPAAVLKLTNKGKLEINFDADLVLLDRHSLDIDTVIAKGKTMILNKEIMVRGTFE